jgi:hypothetical protein
VDAPSDPRRREVDDLRQQLRSLGYLDAGVDRFVLGPAARGRQPLVIALLTSVRIGVLAALLLGPAAAIGVAARLPGLITGARDGFVVAAYLGLLFGVACSAVAFAISVIASLLLGHPGISRRRRGLGLAAGTAFTVACLAYLTLWWDASTLSARAGGWRSLSTVIPLAYAAGVSVGLGHLVTVTTLAVVVSRKSDVTPGHGVPGSSRPVVASAVVLTFCGALLLFSLTSRSEPAISNAPPLAVVSSGARVRVIAIDGFDPRIARRLADSRPLPTLSPPRLPPSAMETPAIPPVHGPRWRPDSRPRCTPSMASKPDASPAFRAASPPENEAAWGGPLAQSPICCGSRDRRLRAAASDG